MYQTYFFGYTFSNHFLKFVPLFNIIYLFSDKLLRSIVEEFLKKSKNQFKFLQMLYTQTLDVELL